MAQSDPCERDVTAEIKITEEIILAGQEAWAEWMELDDWTSDLVRNVYRRMKALEPGFQKSNSDGRSNA